MVGYPDKTEFDILPDNDDLQEEMKSEEEGDKKAKGTFKAGRGVIYDWVDCVQMPGCLQQMTIMVLVIAAFVVGVTIINEWT